MATATEKLIEEVLSLDGKATPGPWDNRCQGEFDNHEHPRFIWAEYGWLGRTEGFFHDNVPNAEAIAHYRTSAPRLARIVRVMEEALGNARLAIAALETTQKSEGIGLLGKHIVAPAAVEQIDEALAEAERIASEGGK